MFEDLKNMSTDNPWEKRQSGEFVKAFVQTIYLVAFKPDGFFRNLKVGESFTSPFLFFSLSTLITFLASLPLMIYSLGPMSALMVVVQTVVHFLISVFMVFVYAGILHLILKLFGGKARYVGTFNIWAYGSALSLLTALPIAGTVIVFVWGAFICVVGTKHIHQLSTTRAVLAYCTLPLAAIVFAFFTSYSRQVCPISRGQFQNSPMQQQAVPMPLR